ncbi:LysE family transporter [Streptomyces sp. NPDC056387]|uniref:LysE family transporter n=1 Tax=Streptomyces sp. NPDC056387 TaxID=3345803 RepID=UPI0035E0BCFE
MNGLLSPALSGAAAGLGVAMPMGAMSVLLLQEAIRHRRTAMAAAAGVATVDLAYAALATALGPWVASHVSPVEAWIRLASAAILLCIAAHGLRRSAPSPTPPAHGARTAAAAPASAAAESAAAAADAAADADADADAAAAADASASSTASSAAPSAGNAAAAPAASASAAAADADADADATAAPPSASGARAVPAPPAPGGGGGPARAFVRYVGLTSVNPTTALYFAALTTAQAAALTTPTTAAVFLGGVATASFLWQQTLVALGAFAGSRISPAARAWTFRLGYGLVAAYALRIAFPLPGLT